MNGFSPASFRADCCDDAFFSVSAQKALALNAKSALAHYGICLTYIAVKNKAKATQHYETLKTLDKARAERLFGFINKMQPIICGFE